MSPIQGQCPSCGAVVQFKVGTSLVAVCQYCRCVIGRGDKKLEDLGKVADVTDSGSPLDLWLKGRYAGKPFDLTGRVQYAHPAGGFWDEWYAHFADDRWGWIAEAQGRFYLTFQQPSQPNLPPYEALRLGEKLKVGTERVEMLIAEKNRARAVGARGEIPYVLEPNADHPFADLSGPGSAFATLDYSETPPLVFVGREVTLDELGIPKSAKAGQREARQAAAVSLNCPQCGAALALRAPDKTERVGCPSCGSLLDVKEGQLQLLRSLHPPEVQPVIPLGAVGELEGVRYTVLGFMQRSVLLDGEKYFWEEYLLYEPREGFRWLVRSDDHWSFVEPLPPGSVAPRFNNAVYEGREFKIFQRSTAHVEFVLGEFYWKVEDGEEVEGRDFIRPPEILSEEVTHAAGGGEGEINWSHGVYLQPEEVRRAFGLKPLPAPTTVGPNQPFPYTGVYRQFAWLLGAAFLALIFVLALSPNRKVLAKSIPLAASPAGKASQRVLLDAPIDLKGRRNVKLTLKAPPSFPWIFVEGELTPLDSPRRVPFTLLAEPGKEGKVYLSAPPAGRYGLDLRFEWPNPSGETQAELEIAQGVAHPMPFFVLLLLLALVPFGVGIYQAWFEAQRWAGSSLGQSAGGGQEQESNDDDNGIDWGDDD